MWAQTQLQNKLIGSHQGRSMFFSKWAHSLGADTDANAAIKSKTHFLAADRCPEAQLSARILSRNYLTITDAVVPDATRMFQTFTQNAHNSEPALKEIHGSLFKIKHAPLKQIRLSQKDQAKCQAVQDADLNALGEQGGAIRKKLAVRPSSAHRWQSESGSMQSIILMWLGFLRQTAMNSTDPRLDKKQRDAATICCRAIGHFERQLGVGLHTDLLSACWDFLEGSQGDDVDATQLPRKVDEWKTPVYEASIDGEILSKLKTSKDTWTQLLLAQIKSSHTFHFGSGEVISTGWDVGSASVKAAAQVAFYRQKRVVVVAFELFDKYFGWQSAVPEGWIRCFDLRMWMIATESQKGRLMVFSEQL